MIHALLGLFMAAVTVLPTGTDVDYQLGGPSDPPANVGIVVRDRTEAPAAGRYNVCYVNGFQTQPDARRFWNRQHPELVLRYADGSPVADEAWGEWLLDLRTGVKRRVLTAIVGEWIDGCATDGYAAVEFDNLDSYTRSDGLLTRGQAKSYARLLVARAHQAGLAAGQKNLSDLDGTTLGFDFAVSEECGRYRECDQYVDSFGDQVLMIEYRAQDFARTCAAYGATHAVVLRNRNLTPNGVHQYC